MTPIHITAREAEVVRLLAADGRTTKQIATDLGISIRTVEGHVARVASRIPGDDPPARRIVRWWHERSTHTNGNGVGQPPA